MTTATLAPQSHAHSGEGQVTCRNCGHEFAGRYCSQCSQPADTHRINWHYIWHEIPHSVWHVDRGILFTLRELLTRPGQTILGYLEGKRVSHYRPLALLLLLGAIVTFASHSLNVSFAEKSQEVFNPAAGHASDRVRSLQKEVMHFVEQHQTLLHIAFIPLYAFWFWLLFRRRGYNYPEILVTQTFIAAFSLVLSLVIVLLFWSLGGSASAFSFVMSLTLLVMIGYNALVYSTLFKQKLHLRSIILRSIVAYSLSYISFSLIGGGIGAAYVLLNRHEFTRAAPGADDPTPSLMQQYHDLLRHIMATGARKTDRTGTGTLSVFGYQMRFDLQAGFPLLTTKKVHTKSIIHELLWFIAGDTNIKYLKDNGVSIWDDWADANGELGPVYGKQWRSWRSGDPAGPRGETIDQLNDVLTQLKRNPDSRRMIVTAWNPADVPHMALPACHALFQFYVAPPDAEKGEVKPKLSCQLYQRSADVFLGVPFNIASYALLTMMVAQECGYDAHEFIWTGGDTHLYLNHLEQAELQLTREPRPLPTMRLNPAVTSVFDFRYDDFTLENYNPHPAIKAPVAVINL